VRAVEVTRPGTRRRGGCEKKSEAKLANGSPGRALRSVSGGVSAGAAGPLYTDAELFEGIANGDERIARELYWQLLPAVEAALFRVLGRREPDHDDLVQSSFEQIVITLARRRYTRACSLNTWASTIAANVALKLLRSRYRQRTVFDTRLGDDEVAELAFGDDDVERTVNERRSIERLRARLSELPAAQAEAVVLHDVMGHPLAEIATLTGASVAAAQSRLVRGRKELMASLSARRSCGKASDGRA
jgi:RNA polymerase sigma-70 factor (ECF subfamily)